jgi:hypothetical protein
LERGRRSEWKPVGRVLNLIVFHLMRKKTYFVWCPVKNTLQMKNGSSLQNVPRGGTGGVQGEIPDLCINSDTAVSEKWGWLLEITPSADATSPSSG